MTTHDQGLTISIKSNKIKVRIGGGGSSPPPTPEVDIPVVGILAPVYAGATGTAGVLTEPEEE